MYFCFVSGYGKIVPTTALGRDICILYALFGIPLTGWLLATVGNFYCVTFQKISGTLENFIHNQCGFKHRRVRKIVLYSVICTISYCIIVLLPTMVFHLIEGWPFRIAHYYAFISLSTIGFGDYVAAVDPDNQKKEDLLWIYDIFVAMWYVLGLSYLACIITAVGRKEKQAITRMRTTVKDRLTSEDKLPPVGFGLKTNDGAFQNTVINDNHECHCQCHVRMVNNSYMVNERDTQT